MLTEFALRDLKVVLPQPLLDLRHRVAGEKECPVLVTERLLAVPDAQAPRQQLFRKRLQPFGVSLRLGPDPGAERLLPAGDLRRRLDDQTRGEIDQPSAGVGRLPSIRSESPWRVRMEPGILLRMGSALQLGSTILRPFCQSPSQQEHTPPQIIQQLCDFILANGKPLNESCMQTRENLSNLWQSVF